MKVASTARRIFDPEWKKTFATQSGAKRTSAGGASMSAYGPTTDLAPAERLQNARRKKLIVGYKSWILPAMNGCSPNQQPRKGTAHEALLRARRLLHGPAHRGSRSRTHLRSRAG